MTYDQITRSPEVMGGRACIRGTRVTVGTLLGLLAEGSSVAEILDHYPYICESDLRQALGYAAWRVEEKEIPLSA